MIEKLRKIWWAVEFRSRWRRNLRSWLRSLLGLTNPKIFCIGRNKTGTTSLAAAMKNLGYRVGREYDGQLLMEDWGQRDFRRLIQYCHSADAFQDTPFSNDYTFQAVDAAFPGSKFILSVRDSPEQWYQSLLRYVSNRHGKGRLPTSEDFKSDPYIYKGWQWRVRELILGSEEETPLYDEEIYKAHYVRHNERVQDYFRHRPNDLLVLNLADPNSMRLLCEFLGHPWTGQQMPRLNTSIS